MTQQLGAVNSIPGSVFHPERDSNLSAARSLIPKPHGLCSRGSDSRMQILQARCKILTSLFPKAGGEEESRAFLVSTTPSWPSRLSGHWLSAHAPPNSNSQESHLGSQLPPPAALHPQRDSCHSVGCTSPPPAHTTHWSLMWQQEGAALRKGNAWNFGCCTLQMWHVRVLRGCSLAPSQQHPFTQRLKSLQDQQLRLLTRS